jgi:23S rRNA (uracil1939-C5)-methyltransferase
MSNRPPRSRGDRSIGGEFKLTLSGMAHGGSAVGHHAGQTIFVPYAIPGETITARVIRDKGRFAYAEGLNLISESKDRVAPRCPHFGPGKCGGCHWQHIAYAAQLRFKRDVVIDQLTRLGGFENAEKFVGQTLPSPDPWAYRAHATFHVSPEGKLGFIGTDDQHVFPIEECHILRPELLDLFDSLELDGITGLNRVRLQVGSNSDDRMIALSTQDDLPPAIESNLPASVNFIFSDNEPLNLIGATHVNYQIKGRTFRVTAGGFFQVNLPQAEKLVDLVLERLDLKGGETVLDLYAGVGLFTAFIAERAALVTSVESYPPAVTDADENLADFDNVDLIEGSVEDVLPDLVGAFELLDAVVVDPPRTGLDSGALEEILALNPKKIVYVSCDPATLARDAKALGKAGYRLREVLPIDMFPQTFHIEAVAWFTH